MPKPPKPPKPQQTPMTLMPAVVTTYGAGSQPSAAAPAAPAPTAPPPPMTNTAETQPDMRWAVDELKNRYGGDMGAGRAIDLAGGKIREAGLGVERARGADLSRRGISGTGAGDNLRGRDADNVLNDIAGAASGIAADAEGRRDGMLGNILGGGNAMGGLAQGDRALALRSWEANEANQRARESAALARQMALLGLLNQSA